MNLVVSGQRKAELAGGGGEELEAEASAGSFGAALDGDGEVEAEAEGAWTFEEQARLALVLGELGGATVDANGAEGEAALGERDVLPAWVKDAELGGGEEDEAAGGGVKGAFGFAALEDPRGGREFRLELGLRAPGLGAAEELSELEGAEEDAAGVFFEDDAEAIGGDLELFDFSVALGERPQVRLRRLLRGRGLERSESRAVRVGLGRTGATLGVLGIGESRQGEQERDAEREGVNSQC